MAPLLSSTHTTPLNLSLQSPTEHLHLVQLLISDFKIRLKFRLKHLFKGLINQRLYHRMALFTSGW